MKTNPSYRVVTRSGSEFCLVELTLLSLALLSGLLVFFACPLSRGVSLPSPLSSHRLSLSGFHPPGLTISTEAGRWVCQCRFARAQDVGMSGG
jgi:hypothetical protein